MSLYTLVAPGVSCGDSDDLDQMLLAMQSYGAAPFGEADIARVSQESIADLQSAGNPAYAGAIRQQQRIAASISEKVAEARARRGTSDSTRSGRSAPFSGRRGRPPPRERHRKTGAIRYARP